MDYVLKLDAVLVIGMVMRQSDWVQVIGDIGENSGDEPVNLFY